MKITEVTQPSDQRLFEQLDTNNDTGFATTDLVKVVRQHQEGTWSGPMTGEELMQILRKIAGAGKV
jgi:hypothetical protein